MSQPGSSLHSSKPSDEITLQRGKRKVTYEKVPDQFAVRLKKEPTAEPKAEDSPVDVAKANIEHTGSDREEAFDVFTIKEPTKLEETVDELREIPATEIVTHVYKLDDSPNGELIPVGTLTVQFKPDVSPARGIEILAEYGLEIVKELYYLSNGFTARLTEEATENPLKIAARLLARPEIETAEPDLSFQVSLKYVPVDTLYPEQWHLKNRGDRLGLAAGADVKAEQAWDITRGKRQVKVCIMDDGFDLLHPDFAVPGKIVAPRDLLQDDTNPAPVFFDDNHGTACAGVAIAEESGVGVVGLAPECSFMPVRMALTLSDNAVVTLFQHAIINQADVISCSWSAVALNFPLSTKIDAIIHHAAQNGRANEKGCVILFAAGNENRPLNGIMLDGTISHQGFALHPDVIAVAASNSQDKRSDYSNFGPELALCAPSSGSPGRRVVTTDRQGIQGYSAGDYTFTFGGTSSATPLAAGLAALILSVNENLTSAEVKQIMMETADKIDEANGEYLAGHSPWYGHGRINALEAVQRARPGIDNEPEVTLEILDVELSVIGPSAAIPERKLMAEAHFELAGPGVETLADAQILFRHDVQIVNLDNEETTLVASGEGQLQPQQFAYIGQQIFSIPDVGRYELQNIITLLRPSGAISARRDGPAFRVVP